jgi:hypothetical protein
VFPQLTPVISLHTTNQLIIIMDTDFVLREVGHSFSMAQQPLGGLGLLIFRGFVITLLDTPHSVGLLWTSDQPAAETST